MSTAVLAGGRGAPTPGVRRPDPTTVLVVEDDPTTRGLLAELLDSAGYRVLQTGRGEEGLRLTRTAMPHAILLDLALPRMSGLEVLRELKGAASTRHIPILVVSAYALMMQAADVRLADAVIQKPFDLADLLVRLGEAVAAARVPAPAAP